jgi:hypothetical protein
VKLSTLRDRLDHERGEARYHAPIVVVTPDGDRFAILSVNWDSETDRWAIVCDDVNTGYDDED